MTVDQKADVITLRGAPGTAARVFTMSGKAIGHITLNSRGIASIGLPGTGMYVIKGIRQGAERSSALATVILR